LYGKQFINRLHDNLVKESKFHYPATLKSSKPSKPKQTQFQSKVQSAKRQLSEEKDPVTRITPYLANFLNKKLKDREAFAFDKLKKNQKADKFFNLLKKHINKELPEYFITRVHKKAEHNKATPELLLKLFQLFRKFYIRKVCESLVPVSKIHKMLYLIRLTLMHRDVSGKRFLRELIRRWRFCTFMKKLAKRKMEAMYKNMHLNLLNMTKEVFGDGEGDSNGGGMISEFESFGNSLGMFTNEDISVYDELKKKFYVQVTKKYQFEPIEVNEEESHYDVNSDPEYYYDEGIGDGTQGRYKQDTNKSATPKDITEDKSPNREKKRK